MRNGVREDGDIWRQKLHRTSVSRATVVGHRLERQFSGITRH